MAGDLKFLECSGFTSITFEEALRKTDYRQTAHCCFYSPKPFPLFKHYENKAYVSMMMRFDGCLGFPGGFINKNEDDIVSGLNREIKEEINLDEKYFVTQEDYLRSYAYDCDGRKLCLHTYKKALSPEVFIDMEKNALNARDYGKEVLGMVRVPVFYMDDGYKGFPAFLSNKFAGIARSQLLDVLVAANIMSVEEIEEALAKSKL